MGVRFWQYLLFWILMFLLPSRHLKKKKTVALIEHLKL